MATVRFSQILRDIDDVLGASKGLDKARQVFGPAVDALGTALAAGKALSHALPCLAPVFDALPPELRTVWRELEVKVVAECGYRGDKWTRGCLADALREYLKSLRPAAK